MQPKRGLLLAAGVSICAAVGIGILAVQSQPTVTDAQHRLAASDTGPDAATVRGVATNALSVHQQLQRPVPPPPGASAHTVGPLPDAASWDRELTSGRAAIDTVFAGPAAAAETSGLENAVRTERAAADHFRIFDAGIGVPEFSRVDTSTDPAIVAGSVDTWSTMQLKNPDGQWVFPEPHGVITFRMSVARDSADVWKVQTFTWDFAPGSGP